MHTHVRCCENKQMRRQRKRSSTSNRKKYDPARRTFHSQEKCSFGLSSAQNRNRVHLVMHSFICLASLCAMMIKLFVCGWRTAIKQETRLWEFIFSSPELHVAMRKCLTDFQNIAANPLGGNWVSDKMKMERWGKCKRKWVSQDFVDEIFSCS